MSDGKGWGSEGFVSAITIKKTSKMVACRLLQRPNFKNKHKNVVDLIRGL